LKYNLQTFSSDCIVALQVIKTKCLQDFIHKFINVQWDLKAQKMKPHGLLLEALLEELYYSTVGNAVGFKLLLEAYEPLLWRNLSVSQEKIIL
jgi:Condensin II non structural maintenance of chromosomes subunit